MLFVLAVAGCATIAASGGQSISVLTSPPGATCRVERDDKTLGDIAATPGMVHVSRSRHDLTVSCEKPGWTKTSGPVIAHVQAATLGNVVAGGVIGIAVDAASGANFNYDSEIRITLTALPGTTAPTTQAGPHSCAVAGTAVQRDRGGDIVYDGSDPFDDDLCLLRRSGSKVRAFLGWYDTTFPTSPDAQTALRKLVHEGKAGANTTLNVSDSSGSHYRYRFTLLGEEDVKVGDQTWHALKLQWRRQNIFTNAASTTTYWLDRDHGLVLRKTFEAESGAKPADNDSWAVVAVRSPPG